MQRAVADLDAVGARWALVGGLAVSARVAPRFTQDVDFAVAVAGDPEAEAIVFSLLSRNYHSAGHLEQDNVDRMSTARLVLTGSNVLIDLLFASSGIEPEIVAAATRIKVSPRMKVPVATLGHLIAMKALAGRDQDRRDLGYLIPAASPGDLKQAREAARLIRQRGFHRDVDVVADLEFYIKEAGR